MRINTNVSALNAYGNLSRVQNELSASMQKLSSGFRINRAGDDAAGLGIANQLQSDVGAMTQASRNAEQSASVLQVMDGATQNIQSILNRMKELAAQSASDTVDASARTKINNEFQSLSSELDRIVNTTDFEGQNLLNGSFGSQSSRAIDPTVANSFSAATVAVTNQAAVNALSGNATVTLTQNNATIAGGTAVGVAGATVSVSNQANAKTLDGATYHIAYQAGDQHFDLLDAGNSIVASSSAGYVAGANIVFTAAGVTVTGDGSTDLHATLNAKTITMGESYQVQLSGGGGTTQAQTLTVNGAQQALTFSNYGVSLTVSAANNHVSGFPVNMGANNVIGTKASTSAQFLVSASGNYTTSDLITLSGVDLRAATLGVDIPSIDLTTGASAQAALTKIDTAISTVGTALGSIGAAENRVNYAQTNVQTAIQNFTAAESTIRDVDMAQEMTNFSKDQILAQAGTAMLAQANQIGAGVLTLLHG